MTPQAHLQAILDLLHLGSNAKTLTDRQAGLILQKLANAAALVDIYNNSMVHRDPPAPMCPGLWPSNP